MNEWLFPVFGALIAFLIGVPLLTALARVFLSALPQGLDGASLRANAWRFMLIVGPSLGTWAWLLSASVHQANEESALTACLIDHFSGNLLRDEIFFGLLLCAILAIGVMRRLHATFDGHRLRTFVSPQEANSGDKLRRITEVCACHVKLKAIVDRIRVVRQGLAPACTRGFFRPRIELEEQLVDQLSDDELTAVLLHEFEHMRGYDPLRFFGAQVALSINPLASTLVHEFVRYRMVREADCDRRAVQRGADPLALARSIVLTAMQPAPAPHVSALGGHGLRSVQVRVRLLFDYAAQSPEPVRASVPFGPASSLATTLLLCPHVLGTGPLDILHTSIERAALLLGWG